jgi:diacylglycerol kinase (ATP)
VHCVLIYNPASGRNRSRRIGQLRDIAEALSALGHKVDLLSTTAPGSAAIQAREASINGADVVFACGGDGTIHEVIQGLISETGENTVALGILPLGSANALARHLHLSLDPMTAVLQQIHGTTQTISMGKLLYADELRYFTVMAGAGPDGALAYEVVTGTKSSLGRFAYYLHAARLFVTRQFSPFEIEYCEMSSGNKRIRRAASVMAVRVDDLGGLFSKLIGRHAPVHDGYLRIFILGPPAILSLPLWFASGWLSRHHWNPFLTLADVSEFSCRPLPDSVSDAAHIQVDGEWVGRLPMKVSLAPNSLRILIPSPQKKH